MTFFDLSKHEHLTNLFEKLTLIQETESEESPTVKEEPKERITFIDNTKALAEP